MIDRVAFGAWSLVALLVIAAQIATAPLTVASIAIVSRIGRAPSR
jgi:hypothetical protein